MADEQDQAEALDEDELGDGDFPPENPLGVDDPTRDDHVVDTMEQRLHREEPEAEVAGEPEVTLVAPDEGQGPDLEKDAVADEEPAGEAPEDQLANEQVPPPAEEAAIHIEEQRR